ncbi:hypothetical protein MPG06_07920 (plasmid) [Helicobacter pylori]|uniref:hypothetical protein n=1 Tax=Helicobacter pylori TaxID=210 RepID=UPI001FD1ACCA|nr:hypothetical protein [Helicobacter pylori]UOS13740.1 hypothetical protein MPG06_07920 [Helicobacter pylori]
MGFARFALSCLILLTQNHLRLTPTISNCDALLSMLANASLGGFVGGGIDSPS